MVSSPLREMVPLENILDILLQELLPLLFQWRRWLDLGWGRYFLMNLKILKVSMLRFCLKLEE